MGSVGLVRRGGAAGTGPAPDSLDSTASLPVVVAEARRDVGSAHGVELLRLVDECLERAAVTLDAIDAIGVTLGPGSFTGLRVALATAKGLAFAGDVPLLGISTLEAFAASAWSACAGAPDASEGGRAPASSAGRRRGTGECRETILWPCLDARKREVYAAPFRVLGDGAAVPAVERLDEDRAMLPADLGARLFAFGAGRSVESTSEAAVPPIEVILLGDGAARYSEVLREAAPIGEGGASLCALPWPEIAPSGAMIALLACARLARGEHDDVAMLVPRYARRPEAEMALEARIRAVTAS